MTQASDTAEQLSRGSRGVAMGSATQGIMDSNLGKFTLTAFLFLVILVWCAVRSRYLDGGRDDLGDGVVPLWIRTSVLVALLVPVLVTLRQDHQFSWLVGLSAAVGSVPLLPLLPFLRDYTHLAVLLWLLILPPVFLRRVPIYQVPTFLILYLLYIATCVVSLVLNYFYLHNVWQLKVGVTFLILFGGFGYVMAAIVSEPWRADARFHSLLDGFVWGAFAQAAIAIVALPLLVSSPFTTGNDTIFGLAYFDKYKSTFSGPVSLGMFFVISVPLLLIWMDIKGRPLWIARLYLQFAPWIMMATGSRTARIVEIGTIAMLLLWRKSRMRTLTFLPSVVFAYIIGFDYQALPPAVFRFFSKDVDPSRNISDRFFVVTDRIEFTKETIVEISHGSAFVKFFGFGPGTGGYRTSGFPTPHNMLLNQWAEAGMIGTLALVGFMIFVIWGLARCGLSRSSHANQGCMLAIATVSFAAVNFTYTPHYWGYVMVLLLFACTTITAFRNEQLAGTIKTCADTKSLS